MTKRGGEKGAPKRKGKEGGSEDKRRSSHHRSGILHL